MFVSPSKVPLIVSQYIESEVIPKGSVAQKAMAYAVIFAFNERWNSFLANSTVLNGMKMAGAMSKDGLIDLDYLYNMGTFVINKVNNLPLLGYVLDENDIEKLYTIGKGMA